MKLKYIVLISIVAVIFIGVVSSAFIVQETHQVVITQFGKPIRDAITAPGVHFKVPVIQKAHFFDKRFIDWDGYPNQIPSKDKRFIRIDTYARWKIADPLLFYQRVRDERGAHSRLDDIIDGETRNAIAKHALVELIRSQNREPLINLEKVEGSADELKKITVGRSNIAEMILKAASKRTSELGIELVDVKFKRINYIQEVREKIFERMITERRRIADKFRSEGHGEASKILGSREHDLRRIRSEAYKTSQEITGKADAQAARIYSRAYNQSAEAIDLYKFLKTMELYEKILSEKDMLLLSTEGDLFKYLKKK
ncbi:protease modulator HflC [bacterium]